MSDLNKEALDVWGALKPMIDQEISSRTQGMVQRRKAKVTTAPSLATNTIGVTEAFGDEMFLPFVSNIISAKVGDFVWIEWMYGATNAFVSSFAAVDDKNLTVAGTLDVVQRRCYATLSSAGWYRVLDVSPLTSAMSQGALGESIRFDISRRGSSVDAETHTIVYRAVNGGKGRFTDESSKSGSLLVDKIRYTYTSNSAHIDIHYNSSGSNVVTVYFDVNVVPDVQYRFTANSLTSVADSPSGETILTTYDLHANGDYTNTDLTVDGVLDVVQRRSFGHFTQAGWYRACTIDWNSAGEAGGAAGGVLHITMTVSGSNNSAHSIDLVLLNSSVKFANEFSATAGTTTYFDKIRYTRSNASPYNAYVDIHFNVSVERWFGVSFDYTPIGQDRIHRLTSSGMASMGTADPPNETLIAEYTFAANTEGAAFTVSACGKDWRFEKRNGIVYFDAPYDVTTTSSGFNTITTLPSGWAPQIIMRIPCSNIISSGTYRFVEVSSSGLVRLYTNTAISSASNCSFAASWIAAK